MPWCVIKSGLYYCKQVDCNHCLIFALCGQDCFSRQSKHGHCGAVLSQYCLQEEVSIIVNHIQSSGVSVSLSFVNSVSCFLIK